MNSKGSVVQSERSASTTSRCPMKRMGLRFPVPRKRATRFFLRSLGPAILTSPSAKPPSRRRLAIASAAVVTLPTESVVLISMSCLKMARANCFVWSGTWVRPRVVQITIRQKDKIQRVALCIYSPQSECSRKRQRSCGRCRPRRQRKAKSARQMGGGPKQQNHANPAVQQKKNNKGHKHSPPCSIGFHQRRFQTAVHKSLQFPWPLENPVQTVDGDQMKPRRPQRFNGIRAGRHPRENDMILIDANKPIDQADEIGEKQIQRRDEERFLSQFRMHNDCNHLGDQRRETQKISNPDAWKRR